MLAFQAHHARWSNLSAKATARGDILVDTRTQHLTISLPASQRAVSSTESISALASRSMQARHACSLPPVVCRNAMLPIATGMYGLQSDDNKMVKNFKFLVEQFVVLRQFVAAATVLAVCLRG